MHSLLLLLLLLLLLVASTRRRPGWRSIVRLLWLHCALTLHSLLLLGLKGHAEMMKCLVVL
jgi:hypothetical protein